MASNFLTEYFELKRLVSNYDEIHKRTNGKFPEPYGFLKSYSSTIDQLRDTLRKADGDVPPEYQFLLDEGFQQQLQQLGSDQEKITFAAKALQQTMQESGDQTELDKNKVGELVQILEEMGVVGGQGGEPGQEGQPTEDGQQPPAEGEEAPPQGGVAPQGATDGKQPDEKDAVPGLYDEQQGAPDQGGEPGAPGEPVQGDEVNAQGSPGDELAALAAQEDQMGGMQGAPGGAPGGVDQFGQPVQASPVHRHAQALAVLLRAILHLLDEQG